jgi:hypothetical protein
MAKTFEHNTIRAGNQSASQPAVSLCDKGADGHVDARCAALYAGLTGWTESDVDACCAGRSVRAAARLQDKNMATIDEELGQIERDIRTLKIEFEQYFGGGRSRPPTDTQWRLETNLKRYADRTAELTSGQRFRYSNLASTYAKYQDMWRKKLIQKESGTTQHHYGAAAKAIQAERSRKVAVEQMQTRAAETAATNGENTDAAVSAATAVAHAAAEAAARAAEARHAASDFAMAFSDPENEAEKVEKLYQRLVQARTETGEKAGVPSLKDFEKFVRQKTKDLKDKGGREIEYTVSIENGRVKLKARVSN